jgi:hypothetical protein
MINQYLYSIDLAKFQYLLAFNVRGNITCGNYVEQSYQQFTYGKFTLKSRALKLIKKQQPIAAAAFEHSATFMLAVAIDTALEECIKDRFSAKNKAIYNTAKIARIIHNAFAHNPFYPKWNLKNKNHIGIFEVKNILRLDTSSLQGKRVDWRHYGGPIALLKFAGHAKKILINSVRPKAP